MRHPLQFKIADMATMVHASRLMVRQAARALDEHAPTATLEAAMAKRFATDECHRVTHDAMQARSCCEGRSPPATATQLPAAAALCSDALAVPACAPQLLGGYGFLCDYPVERYFRDLRVHSILEGEHRFRAAEPPTVGAHDRVLRAYCCHEQVPTKSCG